MSPATGISKTNINKTTTGRKTASPSTGIKETIQDMNKTHARKIEKKSTNRHKEAQANKNQELASIRPKKN